MKNKDVSITLRHIVFFNLLPFNKNNIVIRTWRPTKKTFLTFSQEVSEYFAYFIVLCCIKLIGKFIHQCKVQRGKELF